MNFEFGANTFFIIKACERCVHTKTEPFCVTVDDCDDNASLFNKVIRGKNVKSDILKKSGINYRELRIRRYFSSKEPLLQEEHPYHHRATKGSLGKSSTTDNNDSKSNGEDAIEDSFLLGGYQWWIELVEDGDVPSNRRSHSATTFRTTTAPSIATNNENVDLKGPAKNATKFNSNGNSRE